VQPQENLLNANTPLPAGMPIIRAQGNAESIRNLQKCIAAALIGAPWQLQLVTKLQLTAEGCLLLRNVEKGTW